MCSREQVQILSNSEANFCESVKTSDYDVDLQSKNNLCWLFIVILKQNVRRLKVYL